MVTTAHRIRLRSEVTVYDEAVAAAAISPGHLGMLDSTGKIQKHNVIGGRSRLFAIEDGLRAKDATGAIRNWDAAYAADDLVPYCIAQPGDDIFAFLQGRQTAIIGSLLQSGGDGTLIVGPSNGNLLYDNVAASAAISNGVTTEQFFDKSHSIPAYFLQVGDVLKIRGHVVVSAQASTDTITVKFYIGAVEIVATAAVDAAVGDIIYVECNVIVRTIGATGTIVASGVQGNGVPGTVTAKPFFKASSTLDMTAAAIIRASATWSATSATNTAALQGLVVELLRGDNLPVAVATEANDLAATATAARMAVRVL